MSKVFVYGSLMSGLHNNHCLRGATLLREATTAGKFSMFSIGTFPMVIEEDEWSTVVGEVWEVDDRTLSILDQLEGVDSGFYERIDVLDDHNELCWMYIGADPSFCESRPRVANNDWREYCIQRKRSVAN